MTRPELTSVGVRAALERRRTAEAVAADAARCSASFRFFVEAA